jgi:hypothetical protein
MSAPAEYPLATVGRYGRRTHTITDLARDLVACTRETPHVTRDDHGGYRDKTRTSGHEAGIEPDDAEDGEAVTRAALEADSLLTPRQRRALLEVYDSFVAVNGGRAAPRGKRRQG